MFRKSRTDAMAKIKEEWMKGREKAHVHTWIVGAVDQATGKPYVVCSECGEHTKGV